MTSSFFHCLLVKLQDTRLPPVFFGAPTFLKPFRMKAFFQKNISAFFDFSRFRIFLQKQYQWKRHFQEILSFYKHFAANLQTWKNQVSKFEHRSEAELGNTFWLVSWTVPKRHLEPWSEMWLALLKILYQPSIKSLFQKSTLGQIPVSYWKTKYFNHVFSGYAVLLDNV